MAPHLPVRGEYFVFKLNPSQTLSLILDDPQVAEACEALGARCNKYIGCCINWTGIPVEGALFPFEMSMVSRGLVSCPKDCITEEMSVPILPTTHHPRGRKPLVTDPPLPWDDCYHCTVAAMIVRVLYRERDIRARGKYALMPRQQTAILDFQQIDDNKWREKLLDMEESGGTDFEPDPIQDLEGIEEFYETLKTELDISQRPVPTEEIPMNEQPAQDHFPEAPNELTDLSPLEDFDRNSLNSDEMDSVSYSSSYDSLREEMAHQFDYSPAIDVTLDLETVPADELADNIYDFYEELLEMGEIILAHRAKVAAALLDVQHQDAEFDAKVAAARKSSPVAEDSNAPCECLVSSVSCIPENIFPTCPPIDQKLVSDDEHQKRSEASSTTMTASDADQCIPIPSDFQPGDMVKTVATTNTGLSTTTFAPSEDTAPKLHRRCWRSFTQSMKKTSIRVIEATKKAGSICYGGCTSLWCC